MKRTLTAITVAMGTVGMTAGPAIAATGIDWEDASEARDTTVQGLVTGVSDTVETFTLDTDKYGSVVVHVGQVDNSPLDEQGRIQIEAGDNVNAMGLMGRDTAEQWVLDASNVVLLVDDSGPASDQ